MDESKHINTDSESESDNDLDIYEDKFMEEEYNDIKKQLIKYNGYWDDYKEDPNLNIEQNRKNFIRYKNKTNCELSEEKKSFKCECCKKNIINRKYYSMSFEYIKNKYHCELCVEICVNCSKQNGWFPVSKCEDKFTGDLDQNIMLYYGYDSVDKGTSFKKIDDYYIFVRNNRNNNYLEFKTIEKNLTKSYNIPEELKEQDVLIKCLDGEKKTKIKYLSYTCLPELFLDELDEMDDLDKLIEIPLLNIPIKYVEIFIEFSEYFYEAPFTKIDIINTKIKKEDLFNSHFDSKYQEIMNKFKMTGELTHNSLYYCYDLFSKYFAYPFMYICMFKYKEMQFKNKSFFTEFYISCRFKNRIILNEEYIGEQKKIRYNILKAKLVGDFYECNIDSYDRIKIDKIESELNKLKTKLN